MFSIFKFVMPPKNCILNNANKPFMCRNLYQFTYCSCLPNGFHKKLQNKCSKYWEVNQKYNMRQMSSNHNIEYNQKEIISDKEKSMITKLFPQPRVTLNILASKLNDQPFNIYYRADQTTTKGHKRQPEDLNWICTYAFEWPEKRIFESKATTKRQAAEQVALNATHWLYKEKCIDVSGNPIYDSDTIKDLNSRLNQPIEVNISEKSAERIQELWNDYKEYGIKDMFMKTHADAVRQENYVKMPLGDSSINVEDINRLAHPIYGRPLSPPSVSALVGRDRLLKEILKESEPHLVELPIDQYTDLIVDTLEECRVAVVVGAPGCGKSSRVPRALLSRGGAWTRALVAQPRRVAAVGLAERVAGELLEEVGETVGYQVRLDAQFPKPPGGSILYCTSGMLLRKLQVDQGLFDCTHIIVDEAHERDVNVDVVLLLLKRAMKINPELKVLIMSATLDTDIFTRFFDNCPVVDVPGRQFPIETTYLEDLQGKYSDVDITNTLNNSNRSNDRPNVDCAEIAKVIAAIDKNEPEGAILVFLPGWAEIKMVMKHLQGIFGEKSRHLILPLHSRLSMQDQHKIFHSPLAGVRKIVLSTNIAETSLTISDVTLVLDCGMHRQTGLRKRLGIKSLECVWISQAAAKQRAGRAGRVKIGKCIKLYTRENEAQFEEFAKPEILRVPLEDLVLKCRSYAPNERIEDFLLQLPEPPSTLEITRAVDDLVDLGALSFSSHNLTRLGSLLSSLSVHPRLGAAMIHSAILENMASITNAVTHMATNIELFNNALDRKQEIREIKRKFCSTSDEIALHWLIDKYNEINAEEGGEGVKRFCDKYGLKPERIQYFKDLSVLHLEQVLGTNFIQLPNNPDDLNRYSFHDELSKATVLSGTNNVLVTKVLMKTKGKLIPKIRVVFGKQKASVSPESVNYDVQKKGSKHSNEIIDSELNKVNILTYFGGYHSTDRQALVVKSTSLVTPQMLLLFSKGAVEEGTLGLDSDDVVLKLIRHNIEIILNRRSAYLILRTKEMLWATLQYYIEAGCDSSDISDDMSNKVVEFKNKLIELVCEILNKD